MKSIAVIEDNKDNRLLVRSLLAEFYTSAYMKQYILQPFEADTAGRDLTSAHRRICRY